MTINSPSQSIIAQIEEESNDYMVILFEEVGSEPATWFDFLSRKEADNIFETYCTYMKNKNKIILMANLRYVEIHKTDDVDHRTDETFIKGVWFCEDCIDPHYY